jgi:hypothetical protein
MHYSALGVLVIADLGFLMEISLFYTVILCAPDIDVTYVVVRQGRVCLKEKCDVATLFSCNVTGVVFVT